MRYQALFSSKGKSKNKIRLSAAILLGFFKGKSRYKHSW